MSEEIKVPEAEAAVAPIVKPKQFLLMADESMMIFLGKIMPTLMFVQVEGMAMQGNTDHMLLVSPVAKTAVETVPVEGVKGE